MEKFKNKKTGAVYIVNDTSMLSFFKNDSSYVNLKEEKKKTKQDVNKEETAEPETNEEENNSSKE